MIKTVGLEMRWLPKEIGSLFIRGEGLNSLSYWFVAVKQKENYK